MTKYSLRAKVTFSLIIFYVIRNEIKNKEETLIIFSLWNEWKLWLFIVIANDLSDDDFVTNMAFEMKPQKHGSFFSVRAKLQSPYFVLHLGQKY